nr:hypothetical protein [Mimivirus sp.]
MITNIIELKSYIESFLLDNLEFVDVDISAKLRRPMRVFRVEYPNLYYFAYGLNEVYRLRLSKIKFEITFHDLGPKTRKMFCDYSGVKLLPNADIDTLNEICKYTNLRSWLDDLNSVLLYLGGEREFISKHYDLSKKYTMILSKEIIINLGKIWKLCIIMYVINIQLLRLISI